VHMTYKVVSANETGLVEKLSGFLAENDTSILEMKSRILPGGHIGYDMFEATLMVSFPHGVDENEVRERFKGFCHSLGMELSVFDDEE